MSSAQLPKLSLLINSFLILTLILIGFSITHCKTNLLYRSPPAYVFGTLINISIWGLPQTQAQTAVNRILQDLHTLHHDWHPWQTNSPLVNLNTTLANNQPWPTAHCPSLVPLIQQAQTLSIHSQGLFNPAIGHLIKLWGFHQDEPPQGPPPDPLTIKNLLATQPQISDLEITPQHIRTRNPNVQLDFGAFAKGYAVDLAIETLKDMGIHHAIVNAGGNLKAMGQKDQQPWLIGIRHPSGQGILASLSTQGAESVITSGHYERYREYQGQRYSHILDPRTGYPATGLTSVTVIHPSGAIADAASTALIVAGPKEWQNIARQMGITQAIVVDETGTVFVSKNIHPRIHFQTPPPNLVIVDLS